MFRLALKMLVGDSAKYLMLISGIVFATVLMTQGFSLFCGLLSWTFSTLRNVEVPIWVADPKVEQVNDNKPLRDTDVNRVRSVQGVAWAVPLYQGNMQARLADGSSKMITLLGIDSSTLIGAPARLVAGRLEDLRLPNTVIIDEYGVERLSQDSNKKIGIGDVFEINDHEARIVGICKAVRSFTGGPYVYTTYERAVQYVPQQRKLLTFVLAAPQPGLDAEVVALRIQKETGLGAYTSEQLMWSTIRWYFVNTGIPINVGTIVMIGFIIGAAITAQTFYNFVLENTRNLAALMAMGASTRRLCAMLMLQAITVGFIGYGIGLGVVTLLGTQLLRLGRVPFLMLWQVPVGVFVAILIICLFSALLGIIRIARLEPAIVFR
ncbi:MAG: ABC transporter permease [Verrucomicrobiota bacterium]|nr:ABC transporter permease [Verrucomicrobiota bacterium]